MDLKDVMGMEQSENTRDTASIPPVQQEAAVIPSVPAQPVVESAGRKKKHILPWLIGGGVFLVIILVVVCIFLFLPKNTSKAQAFAYFKNDKAYLCMQGLEDSPVSLHSKNSDYDDGLLFNANRDKLVMLDENGGLYYMPLTATGGEEGAERIDRSVDDVCFWKDSIMYVKEDSLYQYDISAEEETELLSAVSYIYHLSDENTDGFIVCRTDESAWCFDKNENDFVKVCDNYNDICNILPNCDSIYFKKDGDLYLWQAGQEEKHILEDCDDVVYAAEDGSLYFVRSETKALPMYDFLDDTFLEEDQVSGSSSVNEYWKILKSFSSSLWLKGDALLSFDVNDYEALWLSPQDGSNPMLQVIPVHDGKLNSDGATTIVLEGNTAVITQTCANGGQYKVTYTFDKLDSSVYYPQCTIEIETLIEPAAGGGLPSEIPSEGVYYYIDEAKGAGTRELFREELKKTTYDYTEKTLFYFDGSDVSKVADSFWMSGANLDPEAGVFYYETREIPKIKFSELEEYTVDAFTEKLDNQEWETVTDFGFAIKGKTDENLTKEVLGMKDEQLMGTVMLNHDNTALYFLAGTDLYKVNIGKDKMEKAEKIDDSVFTFTISEDGELYFSKGEDGKAVLYNGEEKIAEDVESYSLRLNEEEDGCIFLDDSKTLYAYTENGVQEIDKNVDGDVYALSSSYIAYIKNYDTEAESGTLYVYTGKEPVKVAVGVQKLSLPYFW